MFLSGSQQAVSKSSARDMSEGVIGRGQFSAVLLPALKPSHPALIPSSLMCAGVFGPVVLPSRLSVPSSPEQGDSAGKHGRDPPSVVYGHVLTSALVESDASPEPEELPVTQVRLKQVHFQKNIS